ncbi:MAG TPA: ATPase [Alphaproteobacteria bacterium]|nr:ATPase [Alphaproteobacteria bacterium]
MKLNRKLLGFMFAAGAALYALPVFAEEAAGESQGLPQFDTAQFPAQLFWLVVTFGFLYIMMAFVALPRVKATQDKRLNVVETELAAAEQANEQAKAMIAQYEKALSDARAKAQETVNAIVTAATKESAEKQAKQQQELTKRTHEAEAKIAAARDAAMKDIKSGASDLANFIVEKITGTKVKA